MTPSVGDSTDFLDIGISVLLGVDYKVYSLPAGNHK